MRMEDMTSEEFGEAVGEKTVIILPIGGIEAHGRHLPLGTDTFQPVHVAHRVEEAVQDVIVAPAMPYAHHSSMKGFPGTVALSFDTVRGFVRDFLASMHRHGARRVMIICGHAGASHLCAVAEACRGFVEAHSEMHVKSFSDYVIGTSCPSVDQTGDGHAGMAETSRIMAIRPDLVKPGLFEGAFSDPEWSVLSDGGVCFPGMIQGSTAHASAEAGEAMNNFIIESAIGLVRKLHDEQRGDEEGGSREGC